MAAGLGFKTFTTGEVLTAADTNGYLMQGVLVFASSAARAAAITSPQEGQYSYLKDTNSTEYYDGAAWIAAPIGDITGVTAGTGISGGGTSGTVTVTNDMATTITAAGDIVVGTGSGTYDNLPIGTTAQVLTADTTVSPYKVKWATPAATTPTFVGCVLTNAGNQSIANGTFQNILFDTESFDTNGFHSTSSSTERITIPAGYAGKYLFTAMGSLVTNATGVRTIYMLVNGTVKTATQAANTANNYAGHAMSFVLNLSVADYVSLQYYQTSGGALNLAGNSTDAGITNFTCTYLGV